MRLTGQLFGRREQSWAVLLQCFSWCVFYTASRTLVNYVEATLTVVALYYWGERAHKTALAVAAFAASMRPTAVVPWLFLGLTRVWLLPQAVWIGACAFALQMAVDRLGYGRWVCTTCNFLRFNVVDGVSRVYGTHRFLWYFYEGMPTLLFTYTPLAVLGAYSACLLYTSPSPRDQRGSRMPSSA